MTSETATIRVARATRDLLARQAADRGVSLSALLADIARERQLDAVWQSERAASRRDARSAVVTAEARDWETTLDDGVA